VLVTGGLGFVGRHVVGLLLDAGHTVQVIDSVDERVHHGSEPFMPAGVEVIRGRIGNVPPWRFKEAEYVIHLAAQVSVADSASDPARYITQNSLETARFLLVLRQHAANLQRAVVASSMSVYGDAGPMVKEDAPVAPASVYGLTKYDQERLGLMWGEQQGVSVAALRFFNIYGEWQALHNPYTGVLANFAQKLLADQSPIIFEDGLQTRDFIHVLDVAQAVITATFHQAQGAFNVCTGIPTTILKAARTLAAALGKDIAPAITGETRKGDIRHCTGDPQKMFEAMRWGAKVSFHDGMERYARWLLKT